jgi:hypothetical protein
VLYTHGGQHTSSVLLYLIYIYIYEKSEINMWNDLWDVVIWRDIHLLNCSIILSVFVGTGLLVMSASCCFSSIWSSCPRLVRSSPCKFSTCVTYCCRRSSTLFDRCPLFVLHCRGHQCGMSLYEEKLFYNIYYSCTVYTDELEFEELKNNNNNS